MVIYALVGVFALAIVVSLCETFMFARKLTNRKK